MAPSKVKTKVREAPKRFPPLNEAILRDDDESDSDQVLQLAKGTTEPEKEPAWEGFESDNTSSSDSDSEEEEDGEEDIIMEEEEEELEAKDEEEEELERLVFGDAAGFMKGIQDFSLDAKGGTQDSEDDGEGTNERLDAVADQDLFFFDSGPALGQAGLPAVAKAVESEDEDDKPAWEDSDDERLVVRLASVPQLRKLRETEAEDMVSGKEYVRRLRKQYQRLYPTPDWALHAQGKAKRKRSRIVEDGESEEEGSDMDVDDEDELRAQPLARLLKDADILARSTRGPAKRRKLQSGTVDIQRLKDVCKKGPSAVTSLSFHPSYPMLLSSGPSSTVSLYHVQPNPPNPNPLLTSLHIKRTPLSTTAFHPSASDSRIFLSARRRYFHVWNLTSGTIEKVSRIYGHQHEQRTMESFSLSPDGRYMALRGSSKKGGGVINVLDATTLQWITQARIESRHGVADFVWWGDGSGLSIVGKNGEVTEWSIRDGVIGRWQDEGAVGTTVIAVGGKSGRDGWLGGDRWVAVGSSSGIVNIYDRRAWTEIAHNSTPEDANGGVPRKPKPLRILENLTTPISHLTFSPDGQILCMSSRWKHNALRLVHLPSATVFKNWPTEKTPLGRISAVAWGRPEEAEEKEGALCRLAVGNESGKVRLWEIKA